MPLPTMPFTCAQDWTSGLDPRKIATSRARGAIPTLGHEKGQGDSPMLHYKASRMQGQRWGTRMNVSLHR